jgi:hypothetical protein
MRNASATLIALLNSSSEFVVADLMTIVQAERHDHPADERHGRRHRVSQYDNASHTFSAGLPFTRGATKLVIGTEVDTLVVTLLPRSTDTLAGVVWPAAARAGALDNSEILLEKAIMPSWGDTSPGTFILFWGRAGSPVITRASIRLEVKSDIVLLQAPMPRNVYQAACLHTLFDSRVHAQPGRRSQRSVRGQWRIHDRRHDEPHRGGQLLRARHTDLHDRRERRRQSSRADVCE